MNASKKARNRKVFGRLLVEIDNSFCWFELTKSGLKVRVFGKKKSRLVDFRHLKDWAIGQMTFNL